MIDLFSKCFFPWFIGRVLVTSLYGIGASESESNLVYDDNGIAHRMYKTPNGVKVNNTVIDYDPTDPEGTIMEGADGKSYRKKL